MLPNSPESSGAAKPDTLPFDRWSIRAQVSNAAASVREAQPGGQNFWASEPERSQARSLRPRSKRIKSSINSMPHFQQRLLPARTIGQRLMLRTAEQPAQ
mmetsp:Transcript_8801/g.26465  ORF Transcript_8801/g.26465 Transcript_8801/m.26465 type:complete len:100 (+) Transcript_8801:1465-1764(+)